MKKISDLRREYTLKVLSHSDLDINPHIQFEEWFEEAVKNNILDGSAMTLSTVDNRGYPSSRIVLLKGVNAGKYEFYTNTNSRKALELKGTPKASLLFYWKELERQVIIKGDIAEITDSEAEKYFATRPKESQLSAWVSEQSKVISSKKYLLEKFSHFEAKYKDKNVPKPEHWGGYSLIPINFFFWQGGEKRLHDVFEYSKEGVKWELNRVQP